MSEATQEATLFNADGTLASADALKRAKVLSTVAGCLGSLWWNTIIGLYLPLYARKFGASQTEVGLLATIPQLTMVIQIASAYMVEKLGRRKPFWGVSEMSRRVVMAGLILLPVMFVPDHYHMAVMTLLVIFGITTVLGAMALSPWYAWLGDLIPERERGRFWGTRNAVINVVLIFMLPAFGWILDQYPKESFQGFVIVFGVVSILGFCDIIIHSFIPEPPMSKVRGGGAFWPMVTKPLRNPDFRRFFIGWGVWMFATLITTPFYPLYYREELHLGYSFIALLTSFALISAVLGSWLWGVIADRLGSGAIFNVCAIASIPYLIPFFFANPDNAKVVLSLQAFYGGFIGSGMNVGFTNLLIGLPSREGRGMFIAVFFSAVGALSAIGPVVGGRIADVMPQFVFASQFPAYHLTRYHNLMLLTFVLYLLCLPLFLRIRESRSAPMGIVLSNIVLSNPLRTFANVMALNYGRSVKSSVNAVRGLGASRTRLATDELLARLDDPSVIMREEAILALGEIGDPGAVPALIDRLKDREAYSSLAIIRALGMIKDPSAIETLVAYLDDEDRHVRAAAARALGEIGGPKVIKPLKDLIQREDRPQVIANAVESLGEIGHSSDMWEILPYLHNITNPILKRQVALAIGNLLGRRHEFYHILSKERRKPGRAVKRLSSQLIKAIGPRQAKGDIPRLLAELYAAYSRQDVKHCVTLLSDTGYIIAQCLYAFDGPRDMLLEVAVLRDARFAAGLWFLQMLESGEIEPNADDVLLGLYFLASAEYRDNVRAS